MNRIQFIDQQTQLSHDHTKKLLAEVPDDKWDHMPDVIRSNISWQAGHLVISQFYHAIMVIAGPQYRLNQGVPLKDYAALFSRESAPVAKFPAEFTPKNFRCHLDIVNAEARAVLMSLKEEDLDQPLEPTAYPHPIAKTKIEALTWCFRHEMWHCGQISMIKRVLGHETKW